MPEENKKQTTVSDIKGKVSNISSERKWAMSCYIPVFNIVVCILASIRMVNNKFVLYHVRHGLILFAMWFVTIVVSLISPTISLMLLGVVLLFHVFGLIAAYKTKTSKIALVSGFANKIPEDYIFKKLTGKTPEKIPDANPAQENVQTPPVTPVAQAAAPETPPAPTPETPATAPTPTPSEPAAKTPPATPETPPPTPTPVTPETPPAAPDSTNKESDNSNK